MNWKSILVHLDNSRRCDARTRLAFDIASRFDAHVIGLYLVCQDLLHHVFDPSDRLQHEAYAEQRRAALEKARDTFEHAARLAGVSAEWRAPGSPVFDAATLHGRHADVIVLGQDDPDDPAAFVALHFVEDVVISVGRPVLIVPRAGDIPTFGENVLIGWDDSREAARAVFDALPILRRARFIEVATVERHRYEEAPAGIEISAYLDRQGVRASFSSTPRIRGENTGMTLVDKASSAHADLLVAGAYAHSRGLERVLGGVTRALLEMSPLPVLLSH
ncbi:universal stress protein [Caballeronia ptereochthonis]|uniref:Universal stress protein family protein n=1 Tax=Caballeronia ptereochthonis TaxID=1777144 RepID=A0A158DHG3_9BURK|nr:universal stress protein [Caballeronia ptereochthonis]SAK94008.1 universal stress protein family protein [Caballeronia ptereochthonis]